MVDFDSVIAAARVASTLMLQEDFGPPLTRALILLSSFKFAFNMETNSPWIHYNAVEEPEEEVSVWKLFFLNYFLILFSFKG